jgi:hypothetical protein
MAQCNTLSDMMHLTIRCSQVKQRPRGFSNTADFSQYSCSGHLKEERKFPFKGLIIDLKRKEEGKKVNGLKIHKNERMCTKSATGQNLER